MIDEAISASCAERYIRRQTGPDKEKKKTGVLIVTKLPLHGCIVALTGPISNIHIQKVQRQRATLGTDAKVA